MKVAFATHLHVTGTPEEVEASLDRVMEELLRLGAEDPAIGGAMATGEVEISLTVDAPSPEDAVPLAMTTIRTAIHAAEGHTPNWPRFDGRAVKASILEPVDA
jgi:hypothetical protein